MKSRAAWGSEDYAKATGRDLETVEVLKGKIGHGLTLDQARAAAAAQGINPDMVGKVVK